MNIVINGKTCDVAADDDTMLIDVLRSGGLTGNGRTAPHRDCEW
jgi:aerobic-type carbon monoxide dehydrogenase small subunit (CoxS/CutS family)